MFCGNLKVSRWKERILTHAALLRLSSWWQCGTALHMRFQSCGSGICDAAITAFPKYTTPFSATSQILEKLIIEMHCKIYDWISHRPNIIVVLSRVSLFPASTTLPEATIQGSSRVPAIIQCSVCSPNEPFGKSRGQELLETSTFSLSLRAFLTSSLHPFLPLTHTHTHSPTHM